MFVPNVGSSMNAPAAGEHIPATPAPEVESIEKEGIGQGGPETLVEHKMQKRGGGGRAQHQVCLKLLQGGKGTSAGAL